MKTSSVPTLSCPAKGILQQGGSVERQKLCIFGRLVGLSRSLLILEGSVAAPQSRF
jgi:hypothetical protein